MNWKWRAGLEPTADADCAVIVGVLHGAFPNTALIPYGDLMVLRPGPRHDRFESAPEGGSDRDVGRPNLEQREYREHFCVNPPTKRARAALTSCHEAW